MLASQTSCWQLPVQDQLAADYRAGRLGYGLARVDAVLPDGRLLSESPPGETVADAFGAGVAALRRSRGGWCWAPLPASSKATAGLAPAGKVRTGAPGCGSAGGE